MKTDKTEQEIKDLFNDLTKPLMEYLEDYHHPHMIIVIDCGNANLYEGAQGNNNQRLKRELNELD